MALAIAATPRAPRRLRLPTSIVDVVQHLGVLAVVVTAVGIASRFGWPYGLGVVVLVLVTITTRFWLETAAIAAMVSTFNVTRLAIGGADLSLPDFMCFVAGGLALLAVDLKNPALRRLLVPIGLYQLILLVPVLHDGSRRSAVEWGHRFEIVGLAVLAGALIGQRGRGMLALRVTMVPACLVAVVAVSQYLTNGFQAAYPLGLHKNGAGTLLMMSGVVVFTTKLTTAPGLQWTLRFLMVGGVFACQSRGAMLGFAASLVIYGLVTKQRFVRSPLLMALILGLCGYVYANVQSSEPEADSSASRFSSVGSRTRYRGQAFAIFERSPIYGEGLKPFLDPGTGLEAEPHNVAALSLAEGGVFSAVGLACLGGGSLLVLRRTRTWAAPLALALVGGRLAHGLVDIYWAGGATSFPFVLAGVAVGQAAGSGPRRGRDLAVPWPEDDAGTPGSASGALTTGVAVSDAAAVPVPLDEPASVLPAPALEDVTVLVVAFHGAGLLAEALAPVRRMPAIVVDNSSDPEVAEVAARYGAQYVDPGANLGFAAGVNVGLRMIESGHDVLLLNPDARIDAESVGRLADALRRGSRTAAVAPRQRNPTGGFDRVRWPFPTPAQAWLEAAGLGRLRRRAGFLIGSILLLNGRALADVGEFDERYFLYAEETDWQRRAHAKGWGLVEVPQVVGFHVGAATSADEGDRSVRFHASTERYVRKWFGRSGWASFRAAVVVGAVLRSAVLGGSGAALRRQQAALYLRGPVHSARRRGLR